MARDARPPRWARVCDLLSILLVALAGIVAVSGGFRAHTGGWRVAITSPYRLLLWAVALAAIRHVAAPRAPIHRDLPRRISAAWNALASQPATRGFLELAQRPLPFGEARLFADRDGPRARLAEWAAVVAGCSLLVAAFTWPQVRRMDSVPDMGDPLFSIWRIAWINHQLARDPSALFDTNIFYPERLTLTYSDAVLLPSLAAAPLLWAGVHQVVVYNVLFLSAFVLSGITMYLLVRALTGRRDAAVVSATVFMLHPYRYEHYSHLELQMTMWMPLALWTLHRTMAKARLRDGLATGLAFAAQTLSSLYYGVYFAVYAAVVGAALWMARRVPLPPLAALAAGAALATALIAPIASQYLASKPTRGERDVGTVTDFSARPGDYLRASIRSRLYSRWALDEPQERHLFPHVAPAALALVGAWPPMSVASTAYTAAWVLTVDGSLGMNGMTFPWLRNHVPGYRLIRVPARFSILGGMSLAILCGYGAARLLARWPHRRNVVLGAMLAPIMVEALPAIALERVPREPPAIYARLAGQPPAILAEFPTPEQVGITWWDTHYLYFSTFHWQRLLNGNSGFWPASYIEFLHRTRYFPNSGDLEYLRERGVQYIAWHGAFVDPRQYRRTAERLDARPDLELVAVAPWGGSESRLYRFR